VDLSLLSRFLQYFIHYIIFWDRNNRKTHFLWYKFDLFSFNWIENWHFHFLIHQKIYNIFRYQGCLRFLIFDFVYAILLIRLWLIISFSSVRVLSLIFLLHNVFKILALNPLEFVLWRLIYLCLNFDIDKAFFMTLTTLITLTYKPRKKRTLLPTSFFSHNCQWQQNSCLKSDVEA